MRREPITKLIQICLTLANIADESELDDCPDFLEELGLGKFAFSGYMRAGVKDIIDLQQNAYRLKNSVRLAKEGEEDARDLLEEIFGDRELDTLNEEFQEKIKRYVAGLLAEEEKDEE